MFEKRTLHIYSIIVGLFLLISGVGKVIDTAAFSNLIHQYGFGYFMVLSPVIVIAEILLGLVLILLINPKRTALIAFILLVMFTLSFAYAHFKHGVNDCGCMGTLQHSDLPPVFSFIRNFILILISFVIWMKYPKVEIETAQWKKYLILIVICPSIFISGFTFKMPSIFQNNTTNHKFQNQNIKNTGLSKYIKASLNSKYLFFCFSYTCPHCWNSIENLRQYKNSHLVDSVVTFGSGTESEKLFFVQNFHPDFCIKDLSPKAMHELTTLFPTAFYVEHDTIKVVIQSVLPSPITFKKLYMENHVR